MSDTPKSETPTDENGNETETKSKSGQPAEIGGPKGPEPTRFGDWSINGRCIDF